MNTHPNGRELAAEGASVAADHADDEYGFWSIYAEEYFRRFIKEKPNCTFMTEQVREFAERDGFEPPPDKRAWGSVAANMSRCGVIKKLGYSQSTIPSHHAGIKTLWTQP
jgi:hypothetical protein